MEIVLKYRVVIEAGVDITGRLVVQPFGWEPIIYNARGGACIEC